MGTFLREMRFCLFYCNFYRNRRKVNIGGAHIWSVFIVTAIIRNMKRELYLPNIYKARGKSRPNKNKTENSFCKCALNDWRSSELLVNQGKKTVVLDWERVVVNHNCFPTQTGGYLDFTSVKKKNDS